MADLSFHESRLWKRYAVLWLRSLKNKGGGEEA